jgi:hypothetical protein
LGVANDEQKVSWSSNCDVHSTLVGKKAKAGLLGGKDVASDTVEDHNVFFTALESINCVDLYVRHLAVD